MTDIRHPILTFVEGIDTEIRTLSSSEVDELTKATSPGLGDWFAQWLVRTAVNQRQVTFRTLLGIFNSAYQIFGVADGVSFVYDKKNPSNPLNSVDRHMRFIAVILPDVAQAGQGNFNIHDAITQRTLFLVAGSFPDGNGDNVTGYGGYLQGVSWDPHAHGRNRGMARFYQRTQKGWIYFGDSFNAFNTASANRGPFDGHVGGAIIMKELTRPWTHWFDSGNVGDFIHSLGSERNNPSTVDPHNVLYDPLFTHPGATPFGLLGRAESLEPIVKDSVASWYRSRFQRNFMSSNNEPLPIISDVIHEWLGHILLNRATNIATSETTSDRVIHSSADIEAVPRTLFFNAKALEIVLPDTGHKSAFGVTNALYRQSVSNLKLSLFYRDRETKELKVAVSGSEGPFAFPIIEPGLEDHTAIRTLVARISQAQILPPKAIASMLMVDFCNPLYSPRRESLMKYVPKTATFDADTMSYNVIDQFIANVRASPGAADTSSPESEMLALLATPDETYVKVFTERVEAYIARVTSRLRSGADIQSALDDYMVLAEGRRKIYRGREDAKPGGSGLNEFVMTLPRAEIEVPYTRMKEDAHVEVMPVEDVDYFMKKGRCGRGTCPVYVARDSDREISMV